MGRIDNPHKATGERAQSLQSAFAYALVVVLLMGCASNTAKEPTGSSDIPTVPEDTDSDAVSGDAVTVDTTPTVEDTAHTVDIHDPADVGMGLPAGPSSERHSKWPAGTKYAAQGFWEYLPVGYGNGQDWPLLIFFHGKGENGSGNEADLEKLLTSGPPSYVSKNLWPIAQSKAGDAFVLLSVQNPQTTCHRPEDIDAFIRWAAQQYDVDLTRIYLTGLSCGARGVWNYLKSYLDDDLVAAVVPIAGNGEDTWKQHKCNLGAMPIWAFHGDADKTMDVVGTNTPMDGLAACTDPVPVDAIKTIYEGVGHNSWTQTYSMTSEHDIYEWLLTHINLDAAL